MFKDTSKENPKTFQDLGINIDLFFGDGDVISQLLREGQLKQTKDGKYYKAVPPVEDCDEGNE
jgi:hypothetical protein